MLGLRPARDGSGCLTWIRLSGWRACLVTASAVVVVVLAAVTPVALADPQAQASSLQNDPVQTIAVPKSSFTSLSPSQISSLKDDIARLDPGRIWILVVSPRSDTELGNLADPVFSDLPAGTLISVAQDPQNQNNSNWWIGSSWESSDAAQTQLNDVIQGYRKGQGSFFNDLRLEIQSFASGDAAAGHPSLSSSDNPVSSSGGSGDSSGSSFPFGLVIPIAILLLIGAPIGIGYARRTARSAHRHREESADTHAQAQKDLVTLGDAITALDIASSVANANPQGKDEYRHALGCYEAAERRLKQPDDSYQFQKALSAIKAGLRHVDAADKLFNPPNDVKHDVNDEVNDLSRLADLHRSGALTDAEFAAQKAKLLS
jgi:hypothetical protein